MPDIFVPQDTTGVTSYFTMAANRGLTRQFCFQYTDQNRQKLQEYGTSEELLQYLKRQNILEKFARFAESKGLKRRNILMYKSKALFEKVLYGNIIYNMLDMEDYLKYLNQSDPTVLKAVEMLEAGKTFPEAPENKVVNEGTEKAVAKADSTRKEKPGRQPVDDEFHCLA